MILFNSNERSGPKVIKLFPCSAQLSMKFIMLLNVKMLTYISMINKTSESSEAIKMIIFSAFYFFIKS